MTHSSIPARLSALALCLLPSVTAADPVVVELYTSQGCSSCPPADALLEDFATNDDVIALALHVDYWDFIGWPDAFARPEHGARQKAYAKSMGGRMVYTPQMVIDGKRAIEGTRPMELMKHIQAETEATKPVRLGVASTSDGAVLMAETQVPFETAVEVHLVTYLPPQKVDIRHGENAGRSITYSHVVSDWQVLGTWDGAAAFDVTLPAEAEGRHRVALVQEVGPGAILGALRID